MGKSTGDRVRLFDSERFKREFAITLADLRGELGLRIVGYVLIPQGGMPEQIRVVKEQFGVNELVFVGAEAWPLSTANATPNLLREWDRCAARRTQPGRGRGLTISAWIGASWRPGRREVERGQRGGPSPSSRPSKSYR